MYADETPPSRGWSLPSSKSPTRTINSLRRRKACCLFFLLPTAPSTCCVPAKVFANSRYQKGYKGKPPSNCLFVLLCRLLPLPKINPKINIQKHHKPQLSRITVVHEKSLLNTTPLLPTVAVLRHLSLWPRSEGNNSVPICVQPYHPTSIPRQPGDGNETKQDIKSRKGRCGKRQTLKSFWKWFTTLATC